MNWKFQFNNIWLRLKNVLNPAWEHQVGKSLDQGGRVHSVLFPLREYCWPIGIPFPLYRVSSGLYRYRENFRCNRWNMSRFFVLPHHFPSFGKVLGRSCGPFVFRRCRYSLWSPREIFRPRRDFRKFPKVRWNRFRLDIFREPHRKRTWKDYLHFSMIWKNKQRNIHWTSCLWISRLNTKYNN